MGLHRIPAKKHPYGALADAITACFSEYSKRLLKRTKSTKAPIRQQLKEAAAELARQPSRQKERAKEAVHEDR